MGFCLLPWPCAFVYLPAHVLFSTSSLLSPILYCSSHLLHTCDQFTLSFYILHCQALSVSLLRLFILVYTLPVSANCHPSDCNPTMSWLTSAGKATQLSWPKIFTMYICKGMFTFDLNKKIFYYFPFTLM